MSSLSASDTLRDEEAAYGADIVSYLNSSLSPFHCVYEVKRRLSEAGFKELDERRSWDASTLTPGGKYFVARNGSSLIAFAVGGAFNPATSGLMVIGAHTDSPCPKLKPVSSLEKEGHVMLGVVGYGGGIWHSWFDRDLTVVGRALVKGPDGRLTPRLVHVPRAICRIPTLAIHLSKADERSSFAPNLQSHFPPMLATKIKEALWDSAPASRGGGAGGAGAGAAMAAVAAPTAAGVSAPASLSSKHTPLLMKAVAKSLGLSDAEVAAGAIVDFELQLSDTQPSAIIGACEEFVSSGRLDNQGSCYCASKALLESLAGSDGEARFRADSSVRMITMFDHEEVGSLSAQGADSAFFPDTLTRVGVGLGCGDVFALKARSFQISSDMAHAVHPNYSDRHDPANKPRLGGGLVMKHNANQRYATNAIGASMVRRFAELAGSDGVGVQEFCVKADSACGTTIGPITAGGSGIRTVDVGPPQLSMHSCRELMAVADVRASVKLFVSAFAHFEGVSKAVSETDGDAEGRDPFWAQPGNGWGQKTA